MRCALFVVCTFRRTVTTSSGATTVHRLIATVPQMAEREMFIQRINTSKHAVRHDPYMDGICTFRRRHSLIRIVLDVKQLVAKHAK